jgi:hypothetical protein
VAEVYTKKKSAELGTKLHKWAQDTIKLGIKQQRSKKTLCAYVNDAIGFKMDTEVVLFYSERFFGTADSISFRQNLDGKYMLRIHDLKTGTIPASMEQLEVYAALFCLEYNVKPKDIDMELRIYQNDDVIIHSPTEEEIVPIMDKIVHVDNLLKEIDEKEAI